MAVTPRVGLPPLARELAERLVGCRRFDLTKAWVLDEHRKVEAGA